VGSIVIAQDKQGQGIAELVHAVPVSRTWMLDEVGSAEVHIARNHWMAYKGYFYPHNRMLIQSDCGVGDWTGVITGRSWSSTDLVIYLEDLRYLFDRRRLSQLCALFPDQTAGQVIAAIVADVNAEYNLAIKTDRPFDYWGLTYSAQSDWHWRGALDALNQITEWEGSDWWLDGYGYIHHAHERGVDRRSVVIAEGLHIVGTPTFKEDFSTIVNDTIAYSSRDEDKIVTYPLVDTSSIRNWGRYGDTVVIDEEVVESAELEPVARRHIDQNKEPYRTLDVTICNYGGIYSDFREGDLITADIPSYGFTGLKLEGRVLGRTFTEPNEQMRVVLEVESLLSI